MTSPAEHRRRSHPDGGPVEPPHTPACNSDDERAHRFAQHQPLAHALARRMHRGSTNLEDLEQVACEALLGAIDRFEATRGVPFGAYATVTIIGRLKRFYRDAGWALRVPRPVHDLAAPLVHTGEQLSQRLGREPSAAELADELGTDVEQVVLVQEATRARHTLSLDAPVPTDGAAASTRRERLGRLDNGFSRAETRIDLAAALRALSDRDRKLLTEYFVNECSQAAIADDSGVSQMQISRAIAGAVARLRARMQVTRGTG
ncbi:MAG TPA: sigma-70 family RNA polymerase sigma factor [Acidimicrobiales bacterium]|jgi:RNA polymerase sigma-B factor|nr:sigma-70 family RNA polymerase sigma factor [Acidimicrobiales bacterium]